MDNQKKCQHERKIKSPRLRPLVELRDISFAGPMHYLETNCADCGELLISDDGVTVEEAVA